MSEKKEKELKEVTVGKNELAEALVMAIEAAKPKKITAANRKPDTPWHPKEEKITLKLKRRSFQHGIPLEENKLSNVQIELLNKVRPGYYCDNYVKVERRRDKGINITYPMKTAAQRLRLVNDFGIRSFTELLERVILEAENPLEFKSADEID